MTRPRRWPKRARLLRPGGRLLAVTLGKHDHRTAVEPFDHRNLGFRSEQLAEYARAAGLEVISCTRLSRERKAPHFEVISLLAAQAGRRLIHRFTRTSDEYPALDSPRTRRPAGAGAASSAS